MKTTIALCLLVLAFSVQSSIALGIDIPGGIVCTDGKDAIYFDFATSQKMNLTSHIPQAVVAGPFAVSENGKILVWQQNGKYIVVSLPGGKPFTIRASQTLISNRPGGKIDFSAPIDSLATQGSRSISISPNGLKIAYEFTGTDTTWVVTNQGLTSSPLGSIECAQRFDTCGAVNILSVDEINRFPVSFFNPQDTRFAKVGTCKNALFGNTAFYCPPKLPCQTASNSVLAGVKVGKNSYDKPPAVYSREGWRIWSTWPEAMRKFNIKRNACFPVFSRLANWQKGEYLFAIIYQTQNGWGPVDIYDLNTAKLETDGKPGIYEIPLLLQNCQGLAWTPDGSLSIQSSGKVGLVKKEKILEGIRQSGIRMDDSVNAANLALRATSGSNLAVFKQKAEPVAVNNIFPIMPELIANDIIGFNICWVTESSFLFQGNDGFLYFWSSGKLEKLFQIPSRGFSYCVNPPTKRLQGTEATNFVANATTPQTPGLDLDFSAENRRIASPGIPPSKKTPLFLNINYYKINDRHMHLKDPFDLVFEWKVVPKDRNSVKLIVSYKDDREGKISYAILTEATLESIDNPSKYEYITGESPLEIQLELHKIVAFKKGYGYSAIEPTRIEGGGHRLQYRLASWWKFGYDPNQMQTASSR